MTLSDTHPDRWRPDAATIRWAALLALIIGETQIILSFADHYQVRTALRAMFHLPLYHMFLAFAAYAVLIRVFAGARLPKLEVAPFSAGRLALHLAYAVGLEFALTPLWRFTSEHGHLAWIWVVIIGGYFLSWLACAVRPSDWVTTLKSHGPWMLAAAAAGAATLAVSWSFNRLWRPMAVLDLRCANLWLHLFLSHTVASPDKLLLGSRSFDVTIRSGCSGYEGMGLIACYVGAFLWLRRESLRLPAALVLIPLGMALSWLANTVRLAVLVLLGTYISPRLAIRGFHSQAGWILFTLLGISLVLLVERWGLFRRDRSESLPAAAALPYVVPFLVLLLAQMMSRAATAGFDYYYPLRIIVLGAVLFAFRRHYRSIFKLPSPRAYAVGLGIFVLWVALVKSGSAQAPTSALHGLPLLLWLGFRALGSSTVVPLVEELAFRGYLLRRLQSQEFDSVPVGRLSWPALVISSLAFGLLHQAWLAGVLAGLAYGLVLYKRESLTDAVCAHAITNLCLAVWILSFGAWGLWS